MNDVVDATMLDLDRFAIGQPVPRSEDPVLLRGEGHYADDVSLPGQAQAVMVRSHFAHGVIRKPDLWPPMACSGFRSGTCGLTLRIVTSIRRACPTTPAATWCR